jgi:MFS family permease
MSPYVSWSLVALCFALGVAGGSVSNSFAVFVPSLQSSFDASRGAITVIYSFTFLASGAVGPIAGLLVDRLGLRALALIGISATALALESASFASEVWQLYLGLGLVLGLGNASLGGVWSSSLLGRWFSAQRLGVAIAVVWSASGVGGTIVLPLAQHLITTGGWRHAYHVFALVAAAFIPLLLLLPWRRIERGAPGLAPLHVTTGKGTTSVRDAVREWPFWSLSLAFGITSVGTFSIAPQAMAYLLEHGVDSAYAARALAVAGLLTPLGMIGFSWFADRGGRKVAALVAYACSMLGVGALALVRGPGDEFWLWLYVVLFGGSMGSRGPMISTLATLRYRGAHFGRIYGLIGISVGLGGFLGAWIGGLLHDWTHGYTAMMIFALASFVLAAVLLSAEAGARDQLAAAPLRHLK